MNKVVTINLNGSAYPLEELGYETLRAYLADAAAKLASNPDKDEILADIEQAIGEKCRATLTSFKTVVLSKEINEIIGEMGSVDDGSPEPAERTPTGTAASTPPPAADATPGRPKRLYRIREGAMIGGVCNGLAAYFEIDPTLIRLAFVLITLFYGSGVLVYFIMMILFPFADTSAEKANAYGEPMTAKEFIRRAKAGYYEGVKSFRDGPARREWKRRFSKDVKDWSHSVKRAAQRARWGHDWRDRPGNFHPTIASAILFPILGVLSGIASIAMFAALISLITTGTFFSTPLPAGLHVWMAVLLLLVAFHIVLLPLRIAKGLFLYGSWDNHHYISTVAGPIHSLLWLAAIAFSLWYGNRHYPEVHQFLIQLPSYVHQGIHTFKDWWARQ